MRDKFTKPRPMIDLQEYERRLSQPCSTDQKASDLLAELPGITSDKNAPHKTDLETKDQLSAKGRPAEQMAEGKQPDGQVRSGDGDFAAIKIGLGTAQPQGAVLREADSSTVEHKRSTARAPHISGDIAAIEAIEAGEGRGCGYSPLRLHSPLINRVQDWRDSLGLLGTQREQATAMAPETGIVSPVSKLDLRSEYRIYQDDPPASGDSGDADQHTRSRHPLCVMMATIIVGMGIALSVGLNIRLSGSSDVASVTDNAPENQAVQALSGADTSTQDAAIVNHPPELSPTPLENGIKQPLGLTQAEERPPTAVAPIASSARVESERGAVPPTPTQAQTPAQGFGKTALRSQRSAKPRRCVSPSCEGLRRRSLQTTMRTATRNRPLHAKSAVIAGRLMRDFERYAASAARMFVRLSQIR